ncbi:aldehyde dehydrogenase family protein [Microbacterium invictum]|uniref:aldehyde dehydrogenase (NAD(+)) n=1 Tax=Microbacterium invictum TaxID=515415 RepID=A0AA40VNX7_9MICO|nr:aldehyde dehydrogenase family protein [Microbacterium invictum]MBB4141272.1 aldehyde dehydrogenase (NAD+) [Microbacterium invictum]
MIRHDDNYINGEWVRAGSEDFRQLTNPATEEVYGEVRRGTAEDVDRAVAAAQGALDAWSQTDPADRAATLHAMADIMERRADEITASVVREIGMPVTRAKTASTGVSISDLRHFADALPDVVWEEKVGDSTVRRMAAGVVGAIGAWNGPMRSVSLKVGAAIAAGCTVVVKPSEVAPLTPHFLASVAEEAGVPAGVVNFVNGSGSIVGEAITAHPGVDMVSITGSVGAGARVMEVAARRVKRVALELGGKSANIVLEDADLEEAVRSGIDDAFRNSGQACGALTRLLVPRARLAEAEQLAGETADSFIIGDPTAPRTQLGPLANADQYESVRGHISRALDAGVKLITGGLDHPAGLDRGYYVRSTVFSGTNSDRLAQEEVFGPVVIIIPFDDEDEAIRIANDSEFGLAGGVWAGDREHARRVASRIRTGRVRINGTPIDMRAPHGGFKLSGIGREMGRYGIEDYLEYQAQHG